MHKFCLPQYIYQSINQTIDLHNMHFLGGAITVELKTCIQAILATGVLHNICEDDGIPIPEGDLINVEIDDNVEEMYGNDQGVDGEAFRSRLIRERFG